MNEFYELRDGVFSALRSGKYLTLQRGVRACQLLELPSFDNPVSWDIVKINARRCRESQLFRTCWRWDQDIETFSNPVERQKYGATFLPTIETGHVLVDHERIDALLVRIRSVPVSLAIAHPSLGLDGISYEFAVGEPFCNSRIHWWQRLPDEWRELEPIIADFRRFFETTWVSERQKKRMSTMLDPSGD
jgi:hypothetical protein